MFVFNPKKLRKSTLWLLGIIISGTLANQIDFIKNHTTALVAAHPHYATLINGLIMALVALHNPKVQKAITEIFTEEETPTPDGGTEVKKVVAQTVKTPADDV